MESNDKPNPEMDKLLDEFRTCLREIAKKEPRYTPIVEAIKMKHVTLNSMTSFYLMLVLGLQIPINPYEISRAYFDPLPRLAEKSLYDISSKLFEMGMQTNPIEGKDHRLVLTYQHTEYTPMGGARQIITLPIAVHPSVQKGQLVMHPADYSELIRNTYSDPSCYGRLLAELKVVNP